MKRGLARCTAFCLAAGMSFGGTSIVTYATGSDLTLVGVGSSSFTGAAKASQSNGAEAQPATEAETKPVLESSVAGFSVPATEGAAEAAAAKHEEENTVVDNGSGTTEALTEAGTETPATEAAATEAQTEAAATEAAAAEASTDVEVSEYSEDVDEEEDYSAEEASQEASVPAIDTSMVGTTGFAQCSAAVNVRATPDTQGEVVGQLYNNDSVYIESVDENGWYRITSGAVSGYVASQFIAIGQAAQQISASTGYTTAEVGADYLYVRSQPSTDSEVVTAVTPSDSLEVVEDDGDWLKVCVDANTYGYVSADYVNATTYYSTGETMEQVIERQEAERQAQEAAAQAAAEAQAAYEAQAAQDYTYSAPATSAGDAQQIANEKYQAYLDAQAKADAATQGMDEQLVYDTAEEAQQMYAAYLSAQAAADAAAVGSSVADYSYADTSSASTSTQTYSAPASAGTSQSDADAAYQAYLDAQAAADAATQGMDEQLVYDTAQAAQDAYAHYLSLQNQADQAAVNAAYTQTATAEAAAPADTATYTEPAAEPTYTETAQETVPAPSSDYSLGQQIASYATQFVGNPYVWGGSSLTNGADCSGFTMAVFAHFGIGLPHNAAAQSGCGRSVSMSELQPGDLLFYNGGGGIGHVSIYIGGGQVCHASNSRVGIIISSIGYRTPCAAVRCW